MNPTETKPIGEIPTNKPAPEKSNKTTKIIIFIILLPVICFFLFVAGMVVWFSIVSYQLNQVDDKFIAAVRHDLDAQVLDLPTNTYKLSGKKVEKLESVFIHYPSIELNYKLLKKTPAIQVQKDVYDALVAKGCQPGNEYIKATEIESKNYGFDSSLFYTGSDDVIDLPVSPPDHGKIYGKNGSKKPYICNEPVIAYVFTTGANMANAIATDIQENSGDDTSVDRSQDTVESFTLSVSNLHRGE